MQSPGGWFEKEGWGDEEKVTPRTGEGMEEGEKVGVEGLEENRCKSMGVSNLAGPV